jgi:uncharacterized protein (TIGR02421 family)
MPASGKTVPKAELTAILREAGEVFKTCSRKTKILATLAWKPEVAQEFFRNKEQVLPVPTYAVDAKAQKECREALMKLDRRLQGEHPVLQWLARTRKSFLSAIELMDAIGTPRFYAISSQLYGNPGTQVFNNGLSNWQLAQALSHRLSLSRLNDIQESLVLKSADEFSRELEKRISQRQPLLPVKVEVTDQVVAKVAAGMARVRIRKDARFSELELNALWNHEIESHCLTAHNGMSQDTCDFLCAGGPRTTLTQEGLAVFYEVYGHTMSQRRFVSLCDRIEGVKKVEDGADFVQVYRWYKERAENPMEAFYLTQRIFRGAPIEGRYPFTKDVVYLAGLIGVYNFLRIAVKTQNRILVESLVAGRIALEDVATIAWMRAHGLLSPPRFAPDWLKNWDALLSFFSLTAVLETLDLAGFQGYFDEYSKLENWDLSL